MCASGADGRACRAAMCASGVASERRESPSARVDSAPLCTDSVPRARTGCARVRAGRPRAAESPGAGTDSQSPRGIDSWSRGLDLRSRGIDSRGWATPPPSGGKGSASSHAAARGSPAGLQTGAATCRPRRAAPTAGREGGPARQVSSPCARACGPRPPRRRARAPGVAGTASCATGAPRRTGPARARPRSGCSRARSRAAGAALAGDRSDTAPLRVRHRRERGLWAEVCRPSSPPARVSQRRQQPQPDVRRRRPGARREPMRRYARAAQRWLRTERPSPAMPLHVAPPTGGLAVDERVGLHQSGLAAGSAGTRRQPRAGRASPGRFVMVPASDSSTVETRFEQRAGAHEPRGGAARLRLSRRAGRGTRPDVRELPVWPRELRL